MSYPEVSSCAAPHTVCNCAVLYWLCCGRDTQFVLSLFGCRLQDKSDSEQDLEKRAQLRKLHRRLQSVSANAKMSAKAILHVDKQAWTTFCSRCMHGHKGRLLSVCCLTDGLDDASGMCVEHRSNKRSAAAFPKVLRRFSGTFPLRKGELHLWHSTFAVQYLSQLQARVLLVTHVNPCATWLKHHSCSWRQTGYHDSMLCRCMRNCKRMTRH